MSEEGKASVTAVPQATDVVPFGLPATPTFEIQPLNGWMPIETAPKDGTAILGWAPMVNLPQRFPTFYAVMRWDGENWLLFDGNYKNYGSGPTWVWNGATHWMPLPPAPSRGE